MSSRRVIPIDKVIAMERPIVNLLIITTLVSVVGGCTSGENRKPAQIATPVPQQPYNQKQPKDGLRLRFTPRQLAAKLTVGMTPEQVKRIIGNYDQQYYTPATEAAVNRGWSYNALQEDFICKDGIISVGYSSPDKIIGIRGQNYVTGDFFYHGNPNF